MKFNIKATALTLALLWVRSACSLPALPTWFRQDTARHSWK